MRREIIELKELKLEYEVYGDGVQTILCMHGHGRSAEDFEFIKEENRKVISINLFHHGNSFFPSSRIEKEPLTINEIIKIMEILFEKENVNSFHCFAFSQGGRFILTLLPYFQKKILSISLLSPDGMDNNSFYNWASRRSWLRKIFISWEKKPSRLRKASEIAVKIRLMRPKVKDFVYKFTNDTKTMQRASRSWRNFRNIMPQAKIIGKIIKQNQIPFVIIMGKFDKIIRPTQAHRFTKKCKLKNAVIVIECGHDFFKNKTIEKFKPHLLFN